MSHFETDLVTFVVVSLQATPLMHAVGTGNEQIVELLLLCKSDVLNVVSSV